MLVRNSSVRTSIALELSSVSSVVESMERFFMNFSMVTWCGGDMRFSSFKTPRDGQNSSCYQASILTMQHRPLSYQLLDVVFCLREEQEDVRDAALAHFGNISSLIQYPT